MTPSDVSTLIGMVTQLGSDMRDGFERMNVRINGVCEDVAVIRTDRARDEGRAEGGRVAADKGRKVAEEHALSFRWRVGIAVAAVGGCAGVLSAIVGAVRLATGH